MCGGATCHYLYMLLNYDFWHVSVCVHVLIQEWMHQYTIYYLPFFILNVINTLCSYE